MSSHTQDTELAKRVKDGEIEPEKAFEMMRTGLHIRGRAAKIEDPGVQNAIKQAIGMGATLKQACGIAGVTPHTFGDWRKRAEEQEEPYFTFFQNLLIQADKAIMRKLLVIDQAAQGGNWTAAAWWLERNYPELYALRNRWEVTGKDGGDIKIVLDWPD